MTLFVFLIVFISFLAVLLQYLTVFMHFPIHASIRALIGLLALLIASISLPKIDGELDVFLDWGRFMKIESGRLQVSTGSPDSVYYVALVGIVLLLSICLFRVPTSK